MAKDNVTGKDKEFYDLGKKMFDRINPVTPTQAPPKDEVTALKEYIAHLESALESSLALNKAQANRVWVSLTDEEIKEGAKYSWVDYQAFQSVAWWADEKLKEKNGGY